MTNIHVKVTFNEEVLGTASGNPDLHREYIAEKAPQKEMADEEVASISTEEEFEKAMTVFPRLDDGTPFVYDYQWKGYLKDAFKALKKIPGTECGKIKAYKQEIDGLIFVHPRKIPFDLKGSSVGICQRPLRASTPQGERVALASSETVPSGTVLEFDIQCLLDTHVPAVLEALDYGTLRGFGQWRNSGKGVFNYTATIDRDKK